MVRDENTTRWRDRTTECIGVEKSTVQRVGHQWKNKMESEIDFRQNIKCQYGG